MKEAYKNCFMTIGIEFQREWLAKTTEAGRSCERLKEEAISIRDEACANSLLGLQYMLDAVSHELRMWIALKEDDADSAWYAIVMAQMMVRCAVRADKNCGRAEELIGSLHVLEAMLFPPQTFNSCGHIVQKYLCSICREDYGVCGHILGRPYMGQLCSRIAIGRESIDHVAVLVGGQEPRSKFCRTISFEDVEIGKERDTLTRRTVEKVLDPNRDPSYYSATSILMTEEEEPGT